MEERVYLFLCIERFIVSVDFNGEAQHIVGLYYFRKQIEYSLLSLNSGEMSIKVLWVAEVRMG